jgi:hypothetical protein
MGNNICCGRTMDMGEEKVRIIFADTEFLLTLMTYEHLLQLLHKASTHHILDKSKFRELFPLFYNDNKEVNRYYGYHVRLFDYIYSKLEEGCSIYDAMFYLYPFLDHQNEAVTQKFYEILFYVCHKVPQYSTIQSKLRLYVEFCSETLTDIMIKETGDRDEREALQKLLTNVYTYDHINSEMKLFSGTLLHRATNTTLVEERDIHEHFKNIPFSHYTDIRNRFLVQYEIS